MSITIDHLSEGDRITVIRAFTDLHGQAIAQGERGRLVRIDCPWGSQVATFVVRRANGSEFSFTVDLRSPEGPRHGHMRDYIGNGGPPRERPPDPPVVVVVPPPPKPQWDEPAYRQRLQRVVALARVHDFDFAEQALSDLMLLPGVYNERLPTLATDLEAAAAQSIPAGDREAFDWLYERAIDSWHSLAGQATSGGEGTALMRDVKRARARRDDLRRRFPPET